MITPKRSKSISPLRALILTGSITALLTAPTARATFYYWDTDGSSTAGFGNTTGTWGSSLFWGNATGTGTTANTTITTGDWVNFGSRTQGLGTAASSVTVGTVTTNSITFGFGQTNAVTLSGGTITLGGTSPAIAVYNTSDTISSVLAGTVGFIKSGSGTLNLNGPAVNSLAGGVTINGGTLALDYSFLATPTDLITSGNALTFGGGNLLLKGKTGTFATAQTLANVSVNAGGGTLLIDPNGGTSTTLTLGTLTGTVQGSSLTLGKALSAGSGNVSITTTTNKNAQNIYGGRIVFADGTADTGYDWATTASGASPYTLSAYSGYSALSTSAVTDTLNSRITAGQTQTGNVTTNSLKIENPAASQILGLGNNTLTLTSGGLLVTGTNAVQITGSGANKLTAANGSGSYDLVLHQYNSGGLEIGATIGNNAANATSLTKAGTGPLTLSGSNTFTGGLFINDGSVILGSTGALNSTAGSENTVTFGAGNSGTLSLNGKSVVIRALNSGGTLGATSTVQNANATPATLTIGNSGNANSTYSGVIKNGTGGGALSLIKAGTGTLSLSGDNTFTGGITLNGGALEANFVGPGTGGNLLVNPFGTGTITLGGNATLQSGHHNQNDGTNPAIANAVEVGTYTLTVSGGSQFYNLDIQGVVGGSGTITTTTTATSPTLSNTGNTFTGKLQLPAATFSIGSIGDGSSIEFNGGTLATTAGAASMAFNTRFVNLTGGASATAATIIANATSPTTTLTFNANLQAAAGAKTLTLGGTNTGANTFAGIIPDGTGNSTISLSKTGTGTWIVSGNNTFTGSVSNNASSGRLVLTGINQFTGQLTVTGFSGTGTIAFNSMADFGTASALGKGTAGIPIQLGTGQTSPGRLEYIGSGNSTGNRTIQLGDVSATTANTAGGEILNNGSGTLTFTAANFNTANAAVTALRTLTLGGTNTGDNKISGIIQNNAASGNVAISKTGIGTWVLGGSNSYSGANTINAGTLAGTQTTGTPFGTGAITINAGILSLAPSGSGADVALTGGTVAATTALTFNPGATLSLDKGSNNSLTYTFGGGTGTTLSRGTNGALIVSVGAIGNLGNSTANGGERFLISGTAPLIANNLVLGVFAQDRGNSNAGDFVTYGGTNGFAKAAATHTNTFAGSSTTSIVDITSPIGTSGVTAAYALKVSGATVTNSGNISLGSNVANNMSGLILNSGNISGGNVTANTANSPFFVYTSGSSVISSAIITFNTGMNLIGPGTLDVSGSAGNTFTGGLRINNSTLIANNNNQLGGTTDAITLNGGTLQTSGTVALGGGTRAITLATGRDQSGGTFNVTGGVTTYQNSSTSTKILSGTGSLTKTGAGTLVLSGNTVNTYSGGTTISNGTLSAGVAGALGTGAVTINGGSLASSVANVNTGAFTMLVGDVTLNTSAAGTVTLASGANLNLSGGSWFWSNGDQFTGTPTGTFSIAGVTLDLGGFGAAGTYTLASGFSATGDSATFSSFANVGSGFSASTAFTGGNLTLTLISSGNNAQIYFGATAPTTSLQTTTISNNFGRVLAGSSQVFNPTLTKVGSDTTTATVVASGDATSSTSSPINLIAGPTTTLVNATLDTTSVGAKSGTVTVDNQATTSTGTSLGSDNGNAIIGVSGTVVATRLVTAPATTDLGNVHVGATVSTAANSTGNTYGTGGTGANANTEDSTVLAYTGSASNGLTLTGGNLTLSTNTGVSRIISGTITGSGTTTGTFTVNVTPELSSAHTVGIGYTANVYSGAGVWNTNGSGSYGSLTNMSNWTVGGGAPGLDSSFASSDSATFDSALSGGSATVSLNGANPSLTAITFNNAAGSYNLAAGSGGSVTFNGGGGNATLTNSAGNHTLSAPVVLASNLDVSTATSTTLNVSGNISESVGARSLSKSGGGTLILGGTNTYTGGTALNAGTLEVNGTLASAVSVASGATLTSSTGLTLSGNATFSGTSSYSGNINAPSGITVSGGANVAGVGALTGSATTYGILKVSGTVSGNVDVQSGGTLAGTGSAGSISVQSGGALAPGNSPGLFTAGSATFSNSGNATYKVEIDTAAAGSGAVSLITGNRYDQTALTGNGTVLDIGTGSILDLRILNSALNGSSVATAGTPYNPSAANAGFDNYFIFDLQNTAALSTGAFANVTLNGTSFVSIDYSGSSRFKGINGIGTFTLGGQEYAISYRGDFATNSTFTITGNDVVLTAIPEPGSLASLLGGLGVLVTLQRRRRKL